MAVAGWQRNLLYEGSWLAIRIDTLATMRVAEDLGDVAGSVRLPSIELRDPAHASLDFLPHSTMSTETWEDVITDDSRAAHL